MTLTWDELRKNHDLKIGSKKIKLLNDDEIDWRQDKKKWHFYNSTYFQEKIQQYQLKQKTKREDIEQLIGFLEKQEQDEPTKVLINIIKNKNKSIKDAKKKKNDENKGNYSENNNNDDENKGNNENNNENKGNNDNNNENKGENSVNSENNDENVEDFTNLAKTIWKYKPVQDDEALHIFDSLHNCKSLGVERDQLPKQLFKDINSNTTLTKNDIHCIVNERQVTLNAKNMARLSNNSRLMQEIAARFIEGEPLSKIGKEYCVTESSLARLLSTKIMGKTGKPLLNRATIKNIGKRNNLKTIVVKKNDNNIQQEQPKLEKKKKKKNGKKNLHQKEESTSFVIKKHIRGQKQELPTIPEDILNDRTKNCFYNYLSKKSHRVCCLFQWILILVVSVYDFTRKGGKVENVSGKKKELAKLSKKHPYLAKLAKTIIQDKLKMALETDSQGNLTPNAEKQQDKLKTQFDNLPSSYKDMLNRLVSESKSDKTAPLTGHDKDRRQAGVRAEDVISMQIQTVIDRDNYLLEQDLKHIVKKIQSSQDVSLSGIPTPDILLKKPIKVWGKKIYWIESKAGWIVPGLSVSNKVNNFIKQINRYTQFYGAGVVVWKNGFFKNVEKIQFFDNILNVVQVKPKYRKNYKPKSSPKKKQVDNWRKNHVKQKNSPRPRSHSKGNAKNRRFSQPNKNNNMYNSNNSNKNNNAYNNSNNSNYNKNKSRRLSQYTNFERFTTVKEETSFESVQNYKNKSKSPRKKIDRFKSNKKTRKVKNFTYNSFLADQMTNIVANQK